jgi:hypothetical protein
MPGPGTDSTPEQPPRLLPGPKWASRSADASDLKKAEENEFASVQRYLSLANLTLDLLYDLSPDHVAAGAAVIKEYCDVLCPHVQTLHTVRCTGEWETDRLNLYSRLENIGVSCGGRGTLFDVVFSAIAVKLPLGKGFTAALENDERIVRWLEAVYIAHIQPQVVCFDVRHQVAGTTAVKWHDKHRSNPLSEWEREVRLKSIQPEVRQAYEQLRERLSQLLEENKDSWADVPVSSQIQQALNKISNSSSLLHQLTRGHIWAAYRLARDEHKKRVVLRYIDPCPTCQIAHICTSLHQVEEPSRGISDIWHAYDACQCAEASVSSQLYQASQLGLGSCEFPGLSNERIGRLFKYIARMKVSIVMQHRFPHDRERFEPSRLCCLPVIIIRSACRRYLGARGVGKANQPPVLSFLTASMPLP